MTLSERIQAEFDFPVDIEDFGRCVSKDLQGSDYVVYKYIVRSGDRYIECVADVELIDKMPGELDDRLFSEFVPFLEGLKDAIKC